MTVYHKWQPIADLEAAPETLAAEKLRSMFAVWDDQRAEIENAEEWPEFSEKLRREWAVETGLIERIYTLERGTTETLIKHGIDANLIPHGAVGVVSADKAVAMINDHKVVIDELFKFADDNRQLSTFYIRELHAALVRNQDTTTGVDKDGNKRDVPLIKGDYKKLPNNPTRPDGKGVHEYCPPEHVESEMDRLIEMHLAHTKSGVEPEVEAAWLHHRFVQIHPFQDGNGRVARSLATLVFLRAGGFPLIVRDINGARKKYLDALGDADSGNLKPLIKMLADSQQREFARAIDISRGVLRGDSDEHLEIIIKSAAQKIAERAERQKVQWENARKIAGNLFRRSRQALDKARDTLIANIGQSRADRADLFNVDAHAHGDLEDRGHWFRRQIFDVAGELDYFANPGIYHSWLRLSLHPWGAPQTEILISLHNVGREYRGVLVCTAGLFTREETAHREREVSAAVPLTTTAFQINYRDTVEQAEQGFQRWLDKALKEGIAIWHQSL